MSKKYKEKAPLRPPFHLVSLQRAMLAWSRSSRRVRFIIAAFGLVLLWQLLYPQDRALPFTRLDGQYVSGKTAADIERQIGNDYAAVAIHVHIGDSTYETNGSTIGLTPNAQETSRGLTSYPVWQRLIPLSMTVRGLMTNQSIVTTLDDLTFSDYALTLAEQCTVPVTPARLAVSDATIIVEPAVAGRECSDEAIGAAFEGLGLRKAGVDVRVEPTVLNAPGKGADTTAILEQAEQLAMQTLVLSVDGEDMSIPKETIVQWLTLPYDDTAESYSIAVDDVAVRAYVKDAQSRMYIEPGVTHIRNDKNGIELGREEGETGRGLDIVPVAAELTTVLLSGGGTVKVSSITLAPTVSYDNPYSPDRAGLQRLLDDLVKNKGDFGISIQTAESNLKVSSNGTGQYKPASTYKMIVGWAILKRIDAGQLRWTDAAVNGLTVDECFDTMIIDSDNPCAEYFGEKVIGWRNLNTIAQELGMTCSDWNAKWYSCAQDEALFLHKLQAGELLDEVQTERLLSVMRAQAFRRGIPTGVNWTVADKVGFLNGLLHDAAVVYAPAGTYALVILTDKSSWAEIADAAWQIDAQLTRMNQ